MIAWQQEGLEPAPLMPESQLAEQELRPRVPASQLTPGHYWDLRETTIGLVNGRSSGQCNHNATIGTHLEHENIRTVIQSNTVSRERCATWPFPQHEGSWVRHVPLSQASRVDQVDTVVAWEATARACQTAPWNGVPRTT